MTGCRRGAAEALAIDGPEWFQALQTHVIAVQANDRAVRLFREGRLDDAIAELDTRVSGQSAVCYWT